MPTYFVTEDPDAVHPPFDPDDLREAPSLDAAVESYADFNLDIDDGDTEVYVVDVAKPDVYHVFQVEDDDGYWRATHVETV